jgi:4-hydroxyacetophenone monooxygenase
VSTGNDRQRQFLTDYLERHLGERSDLREICLPRYPPYVKRMLLDHGWFEAIQRPNVEVVAQGVASFTKDGVVGADGATYPADVIILCTGFRPQTPLFPMEIRGRSGVSIRDVWGLDEPSAYLGTTVPDFPNFFMVRGPNTTPGGGSSVFITECQIRYITRPIQELVASGHGAVEVRQEVHDEYNSRLQDKHDRMVWSHRGAESYYRNARGKVVVNMPWRVVDYWRMTKQPDLDDYRFEPSR